jgi:hypothetical protein
MKSKQSAKKFTAWALVLAMAFALMPAAGAGDMQIDLTRYKDVSVNLDSDMMNALGLGSADEFTDLLEQYLTTLGVKPEKILVSGEVTQIDTTDLSQFYVFDHYDTGIWGSVPNAADWEALYKHPPSAGSMRPFFPYSLPSATTYDPGKNPYYHNNADYGSIQYNNTLEQLTDINNYDKSVAPNLGNNFYGNFGLRVDGTNPTNANGASTMPTTPSNSTSPRPENTLKNNLYYTKTLREHIHAYEDETGNPAMWFFGYHTGNYTDFAFYPAASDSEKSVSFTVDFNYVNAHAMSGAGFVFNTGIDSSGNLQGYVLYLGLLGGPDQPTAANRLARPTTITVYRINNGLTPASFHGSNGSNNTAIANIVPNMGASVGVAQSIDQSDTSAIMDVLAQFSDAEITVWMKPSGAQGKLPNDATITFTRTLVAPTGFYGFGPLVQHTAIGHTCARSSAFKFCDLEMSIATDAFSSITGGGDEFRFGNDVDRFFVNLVGAPVNGNSPDYWDGIDALRANKTFYITQNTDNTVTESYPGQTPAADNLTNGMWRRRQCRLAKKRGRALGRRRDRPPGPRPGAA